MLYKCLGTALADVTTGKSPPQVPKAKPQEPQDGNHLHRDVPCNCSTELLLPALYPLANRHRTPELHKGNPDTWKRPG